MKRGESLVFGAIAVFVAAGVLWTALKSPAPHQGDVPFHSTAPAKLREAAGDLIRRYGCRECHSLSTVRSLLQAVPAPMLDGIGSLRSEAWLYDYLSAADPQSKLASRLKREYRMPSYASLPEAERRTLASYLASLRVDDWYLDQTRRLEHDKLTGEDTAEK